MPCLPPPCMLPLQASVPPPRPSLPQPFSLPTVSCLVLATGSKPDKCIWGATGPLVASGKARGPSAGCSPVFHKRITRNAIDLTVVGNGSGGAAELQVRG